MSKELLNNEEAQFNALQSASLKIAEQCNLITVTDATTLAIAHQNLSILQNKIKSVEDLRVKLKEPSLREGQAIDALAKKLSTPMKEALDNGKKKILYYENAEKLRVQKLKDKIKAYSDEAIREMSKCFTLEKLTSKYIIYVKEHFPPDSEWADLLPEANEMRMLLRDYASQRKIEIQSPEQADDGVGEMIAEAITESVDAVELEKVKGLRGTWKAEIINMNECPNEWKDFNEQRAKQWRKENADVVENGAIIHGVRFYIEESITIK